MGEVSSVYLVNCLNLLQNIQNIDDNFFTVVRCLQESDKSPFLHFALQNFGMLFSFVVMFILGVYKKQISVN